MPIPTDFVSANTRMLEAYATISTQFAEQAQDDLPTEPVYVAADLAVRGSTAPPPRR